MGRETVIKNIREALRHKNELPGDPLPVAPQEEGDVALLFARRWLDAGAAMSYCTDEVELSRELEQHGPVLLCEALLADTAQVLLSDRDGNHVDLAHLPACPSLAAFTSQVVADWEAALSRLKEQGMPRNLLPLAPKENTHLILIEDL